MFEGPTLDIFLSVTMVCVIALIAGAIVLLRKGNETKRAGLMLIAALVLFGNVLIWAWPV